MEQNLNQDLSSIGYNLAVNEKLDPFTDIERTLILAIMDFPDDGRLVSLTFSWLLVHGRYVIVEKLAKLAYSVPPENYPSIRWVHALAAFASMNGLHKWKKLMKRQKEPVYLYPKEITETSIKLKGEEKWLADQGFLVPCGSIRIREGDAVTSDQLLRINNFYRNRLLYGACWRADIITDIQSGYNSPTKIMKILNCSYEPAHRVFKEYNMAIHYKI